MSEKKVKTYTAEFKESAVKLAVESDRNCLLIPSNKGSQLQIVHTT